MGPVLEKLKANIEAMAQKEAAECAQWNVLCNDAGAKVTAWLTEHGVTSEEFTIEMHFEQASRWNGAPMQVACVTVCAAPKGYRWRCGGGHMAEGKAYFDADGTLNEKHLVKCLDALVVPESWEIAPAPVVQPDAQPAPVIAPVEQRFVSVLVELLESYGYRISTE